MRVGFYGEIRYQGGTIYKDEIYQGVATSQSQLMKFNFDDNNPFFFLVLDVFNLNVNRTSDGLNLSGVYFSV
ncbi:hypothetical protein [Bacillus pseudomycoides]|uniref:hypothetical protein n=1 Tax=Bacillus pseudomycoides TaxID=64104 RepID=UPI00059D4FA9|nr:hypothetical protein [Bacillus pseudomycoides]PGC43496.1 hypothetical protein COM18_04020 [Bacillus pseudomycoides]